MIMSQYLGRGSTSRGRMTIRQGLDTFVSDPPYLKDENDKLAVIASIDGIRKALSGYANLKFSIPSSNQTTKEYVDGIVVSAAKRRANHWLGRYFRLTSISDLAPFHAITLLFRLTPLQVPTR